MNHQESRKVIKSDRESQIVVNSCQQLPIVTKSQQKSQRESESV